MRKDIMEHAGLAIYAEIALIIFVAVFVMIILRAILMRREHSQFLSRMPLEDGLTVEQDEVSP
ncbi:MAG: hypothetical protein H0U74_20775 [Bradymonadaceae bacterium]|nr:hypothetical protein [Lujinxingiaceae bacterium]